MLLKLIFTQGIPLIRAIIELEHHDVNIIRRNRYIKGMPKAVFLVMEVLS